MQTKKILSGFAIAGLLLAVGAPSIALAAAPATFQVSNVIRFDNGNPVAGAATLTRTRNAVWADIHTSGLRKNTVYTMWWVVWNRPQNCVDGCGEDDVGIKGSSVFYAGGFLSGADGTVNTSVHVEAGNLRGGVQVLFGPGLMPKKGNKAEMHLVIRSHGKPKKGQVDEQISTVGGLCDIRKCTDDQAVVFQPL